MSLTLKDFIFKKYNEFINELKPIVDTNLFPSIDDVDIVDLLALLEIFFPINQSTKISLENVIVLKEFVVEEDTVDKIVPILDKFLKVIEKVKCL